MKIHNGPWGGGNQFGKSLSSFLKNKGWKVVYDLKSNDIDIILLTEPRKNLQSCVFNHKDIVKYLLFRNSGALVVHRINECDERKGTKGVNKLIIKANFIADYTIYISHWLKDLYVKQNIKNEYNSVVLNGGDTRIFNSKGGSIWKSGKLKIVTHHWGGNFFKGFDIYKKLDCLLSSPKYSSKFEFTFIGNLPNGLKFINSKYIFPLSEGRLTNELKKNHVYLTASQNEPAGMHHIEGALCGLPLLYRNSGALPEYCRGFGVPFIYEDFEKGLQKIKNLYPAIKKKIYSYPHTSEKMCNEYYKIFLSLLKDKNIILQRRKRLKNLPFLIKVFL